MDRKSFTLKALADEGTGEAVIATLGVVDRDGDVIEPGAFGEQTAKLIPAHDWSSVWLGKARVFERGNEAIAAFKINLEIPAAKDWHSALKFDLADGKPIGEWSWGFSVDESGEGKVEERHVRLLKKVTVHEVSPVLLGAGIGTRTLGVKSGKPFADEIAAVLENVCAVVTRGKSILEMRKKDGRGLSVERVGQIEALKKSLDDLGVAARELEAIARGDLTPVDTEELLAQYELTRARLRNHLAA